MTVKDAVLFGLVIILFSINAKSVYLYRELYGRWSHDNFRIACLEYADEYPEFGMHFIDKQDEEWRFQCVDKTGKSWFRWK